MKKRGFVHWLIQYKEFGASKATNVVGRLNQLSDDVCLDYGIPSIFANDKFYSLAKWRVQVCKNKELSASEKKDIELYGDYLQMLELSHVSYDEQETPALVDYCKSMKMSYSYKPVLLLSIAEAHEAGVAGSYNAIVEYFIKYYRKRLNDGELAEKPDSIFADKAIDYDQAKAVIENNPVKVLRDGGIVNFNSSNDYLDVTSEYYFEKDEIEDIKEACRERLEAYYSRIVSTKPKEKQPYEELKELIEQVENSHLRKQCLEALEKLKMTYDLPVDSDSTPRNNEVWLSIAEDDERKIGKLVRETMEALSQSGFAFGTEYLDKCFTKEWSKATFGLFYPLFREYDKTIPIDAQTKDYLGNNRYYGKVYKFGEREVLITSEWYKESKDRYIKWINTLREVKNNT